MSWVHLPYFEKFTQFAVWPVDQGVSYLNKYLFSERQDIPFVGCILLWFSGHRDDFVSCQYWADNTATLLSFMSLCGLQGKGGREGIKNIFEIMFYK